LSLLLSELFVFSNGHVLTMQNSVFFF
jgi:hypothetical protein